MTKVRVSQLAQSGAAAGQAVVWNAATGQWQPGTVASGSDTAKVSRSLYSAKGVLLLGLADQVLTPGALVVGTDGHVLTADSTLTAGVGWKTPDDTSAVKKTLVDAKGDLLVGVANDTVARLAVGSTDGHVLVVSTAAASGMAWAAPAVAPSGFVPASLMDAKGDLLAASAPDTVVRLGVGTDGQVLTALAAAASGLVWATPSAGGSATPSLRSTVVVTTPQLAAGATHQGVILIAAGYRLYSVQTDRAARVRLYTSISKRTADLPRLVGTNPEYNSGLVLDYVMPASGVYELSPLVDGFITDGTVLVPMLIANNSVVAGTITVTLTYVRTE